MKSWLTKRRSAGALPPETEFQRVLEEEKSEIARRRAANGWTANKLSETLFGIGLSGGGIRSATFNLGLLQGLSAKGLLQYVDYLSTVSGGGYIGSWLHGAIRRLSGGDVRSVDSVLNRTVPGGVKEDPVSWLRAYSNYLAPRVSVFSLDVWVLGTLWIRNFFLIQTVLLPAVAAVLLLPVLFGLAVISGDRLPEPTLESRPPLMLNVPVFLWCPLALLAIAAIVAAVRLRPIAFREVSGISNRGLSLLLYFERKRWFPDAGLAALLLFASAVLLALASPVTAAWVAPNIATAVAVMVSFGFLSVLCGFPACYKKTRNDSESIPKGLATSLALVFAAIAAAVSGCLLLLTYQLLSFWRSNCEPWAILAWGPALTLGSILAGIVILIGLMGADYPDACREWLSRTCAVALMMLSGWCFLFAVGVYSPYWIASFVNQHWGSAVLLGGWILTTVTGLLAGRSPRTANEKSAKPLELLAKAAPSVFMIGYLVLVAFASHAVLRRLTGADRLFGASEIPVWVREILSNHWTALHVAPGLQVSIVVIGLAAVSLFMGWRVNINEFSIHHLYKHRIARAYLGASNRRRRPNEWTGFDPEDDFKLTELVPKKGYFGPLPILNAAVNLNAGSELAKQERKASSFFFTPLYSGYTGEHGDAFVKTDQFMMPKGPALGTVTAISGAAANPNMGYHTAGPVAFLLTVFNLRLGWWVGNPRTKEYTKSGPLVALSPLVNELLGRTHDKSNYINLSDGGHFDNLGLYELVRRRCRYIIIGDGEQDAQYSFGSLAGTIRRCRADFGVEIDLDFDRIRPLDGRSRVHAVMGTVSYPDGPEGQILYIKSSLTGDEPEDIREFKIRHADYPHQSTGDQFFSESQFESYRKLGLHIAESVFEDVQFSSKNPSEVLPDVFQQLSRNWYPPLSADGETTTRLADAYSALMARLAGDPDLRFLDAQVLPNASSAHRPACPVVLRRARFFCIDCIQLMENVYFELNFRSNRHRSNPNVAGWIRVFRLWKAGDEFEAAWSQVRTTYNPLFQRFYDSL